MEWSEFSRVSARTVRRAQIVVKGVCGDVDKFYKDVLVGESGLCKVLDFLSTVRKRDGGVIRDSTKQGYLSSISRLLTEAGLDNRCYADKVLEMSKKCEERSVVPVDGRSKAIEILERMMYKCSKDLAVLAALIYYECDRSIQVQHMCCMRCDVNEGGVNYLDLDRNVLYVKSVGKATKSIKVPSGFSGFIRSLKIDGLLLGGDRKSSAVSNAFVRAAGCSYTVLREMYGMDDEISEISEITDEHKTENPGVSKVVERSEITGVTAEHKSEALCVPKVRPKVRVCPDDEIRGITAETPCVPKVVIKVRPKLRVRPIIKVKSVSPNPDGIEWVCMEDDECGATTNKMRHDDVCRLQSLLNVGVDRFYYGVFVGEDAYETVSKFLKSKKPNTCSKYLGGLCKMLASTECGVQDYRRYYLLYHAAKSAVDQKLGLVSSVVNVDEPVVDFCELVTKAREVYRCTTKSKVVRLFGLIILESVEWSSSTVIGVLRMSDIIRMKFVDEDGASYIDIVGKCCYIRSGNTKNRTARELKLSDHFVDELRCIYGETFPEWVIMSDAGQPYQTPNGVRVQIVNEFKCPPGIIRASYATYLHDRNIPMTVYRKICHNMGHSHQTSVLNYVHKNVQDVED